MMTRMFWLLITVLLSTVVTSMGQTQQRETVTAIDPMPARWSFIGKAEAFPAAALSTQPSKPTSRLVPSAHKSDTYPATIHERFATFIADEDFKSQLLVQNLRLDVPVTVAPSLILSNGEVPLDRISIPAHTAVSVDINSALRALNAKDTSGTVVLRYDFSTYGAVSAVVEMSDYSHHLYWNSVAQSREEFWYGTSFDAVVWSPDEDTEGFISIINTSTALKNVQIAYMINGLIETKQELPVGPHEYLRLPIGPLVRRSTKSGAGVHLAFNGKPGDIVAEGTLLNRKTGFSKSIRFVDTELRYANPSLRTNFLLLGRQPAADGFPATVLFRSVAALRNTSTTATKVTPEVKYLQGSAVRTVTLDAITLNSQETRLIDFAEEQRAGRLPLNFSQGRLMLTPQSNGAAVIAELFNFNGSNGGYVVGPSFTAHPARATSGVWRTDGSFQTTLMVENAATQDDVMTVKLFGEGGIYEKDFPVAAGGLMKVNIGELQQDAVRDKNGNLLLGTSGTASITGAHGSKSALAYDKIIHSADESDYVGHVGSPCDFVSNITGFLTGALNPFTAMLEEDWTDGETYDYESSPTSSNTTLVSVSGSTVTFHPDSQSHTVGLLFTDTTETCDECTTGTLTDDQPVTVPPQPFISEIDPPVLMIGSNNISLTIKGGNFGSSVPTVNLPQGVTNQNQGGNTASTIVITVNVTFNATLGVNTLNVVNNDSGLGSAPADFTIDGPNEMIVQSDTIGFCNGCSSTVRRLVTYLVQDVSGAPSSNIPICETPFVSGWNCAQQDNGANTAQCNVNNSSTNGSGQFTDSWTLNSDVYTPKGCGLNISDQWDWAASPSSILELGSLAGYLHTDTIEINGSITPPQANSMPVGTIIPK
jgi:hypothetical protein